MTIRFPVTKKLHLIALCAVLALVPHAADATSRRKSASKPHPAVPARAFSEDKGSYYVPYAQDAGGRRVPIMQIPGSVTIVPRQVIDDQQDTTICGALRNVSGVMCR
jgi:outer membrane receptor for ferric coprogen and ferric-rhodotorulic acid